MKRNIPDSERARKTLYVTGFNPKHTSKQLLEELFTQGGPVRDITLFDTHAYVLFEHEESVPYCLALLNEVELHGNKLRINPRMKSANAFSYLKYLSTVRKKLMAEYRKIPPPDLPPKKMPVQKKYEPLSKGKSRNQTKKSNKHNAKTSGRHDPNKKPNQSPSDKTNPIPPDKPDKSRSNKSNHPPPARSNKNPPKRSNKNPPQQSSKNPRIRSNKRSPRESSRHPSKKSGKNAPKKSSRPPPRKSVKHDSRKKKKTVSKSRKA